MWRGTRGLTYQEQSVARAARLCPLRDAKILIVGANNGADCRLFIDRGAAEVHGLDIIEGVGAGYSHPSVRYHQASIEGCSLPSNYFDLIFSVATMEHVPNIRLGFTEMVRLAKVGGKIISSASPLWQSPYGHHMSCLDGHPWAHLIFQSEDLVSYAKHHGITGERGIEIENIIAYMLDPRQFNMVPGLEYVSTCAAIPGIKIHRNCLGEISSRLLNHPLGKIALSRGFLEKNLLGEHHYLFATKIGN